MGFCFYQVLSRSVANALNLKNDPALSSTIEFIEKLNDIFDIFNIRNNLEGSRSRNKFKEPLTSPDDWRFEVSRTRFHQ